MTQKYLLLTLIFLINGCAGTLRIAKEDVKNSTIPSKHIIVKPNN